MSDFSIGIIIGAAFGIIVGVFYSVMIVSGKQDDTWQDGNGGA